VDSQEKREYIFQIQFTLDAGYDFVLLHRSRSVNIKRLKGAFAKTRNGRIQLPQSNRFFYNLRTTLTFAIFPLSL